MTSGWLGKLPLKIFRTRAGALALSQPQFSVEHPTTFERVRYLSRSSRVLSFAPRATLIVSMMLSEPRLPPFQIARFLGKPREFPTILVSS
jgi:hypothetical protein